MNNGEHPVHKYAQGGLVQGEPTPEDVANFGTPDDMTSAPVAEVAAPTVLDPRYTDAMDQSAKLRGQAGLLNTFLGAMEGSGGGYKADRSAVDSLNRMSEDPMSKYKQLVAQETAAKAGKKEAAKESRDIESHKMNLDKGALDLESGKLGNTKSQLDIDKAQRAADSDIELDDKDSSASQFARARGQKKMADLGYKVPITENMTARQISSLPGMKEDLNQFFKDKEQSKTLAGAKDIAVLNRTSAEKIAEIGADAKSESNKEKVAANDEKDMDKDVKALTKHLTLGWAARGGQAGVIQNKINSAEAAEALIDQGRKQPGGLDSRQIEEVAQSTAKLLGGGNTASARVEALVPHTMMGRAQTFKEWLSNKPQGQEMQEFVDRLGETITREKVLALKQKQQFQVSGLSAHNRLKQKHPDLYRETLLANKIDPDTVDSVKMMGPDGKVRFIPKDQVEAAKKAGGKEVKE